MPVLERVATLTKRVRSFLHDGCVVAGEGRDLREPRSALGARRDEAIFVNDSEGLSGEVDVGPARGLRVSEEGRTHLREGRSGRKEGRGRARPGTGHVQRIVRNCPELSGHLPAERGDPLGGGVGPSWRRVVMGVGTTPCQATDTRWCGISTLPAKGGRGRRRSPTSPGTSPPRPVTLPAGCPAAPSAP